jgi:hypothetical protein
MTPGQPGSFDELIDLIRGRLLPVLWSKWGIEVGGELARLLQGGN